LYWWMIPFGTAIDFFVASAGLSVDPTTVFALIVEQK